MADAEWVRTAEERGRAFRKAVFGEASLQAHDDADDFNAPLQDMVTRTCFGEIWTRPGLPRKTRSMITVALLIGMSRQNQLKNHVKAAIANGVTKEELKEILIHTTSYVGLPAGADNWGHVVAALKEIDAY
jgi:4-carboxymuconolactone decarboxylase